MVGGHWLRFARNWLDESTVDCVIEPMVADWQHELRAANGMASVTVRFRGHLALARSVVSCLLRQSRQPLPDGVAVKAWYLVEAFATLGVFLVTVIAAYTSDGVARTIRRHPAGKPHPRAAARCRAAPGDDDEAPGGHATGRAMAGGAHGAAVDARDGSSCGLDRAAGPSWLARERRRPRAAAQLAADDADRISGWATMAARRPIRRRKGARPTIGSR